MARNKVQCKKGLSEATFETLYGTDDLCRAVVIASRWPDGFKGPPWDARAHSAVTTRGLFQCSACRRQTSPIAGTIFASTHLQLRLWFRAMYHMTQSKQGNLQRRVGLRLGVTQTTAWKIKHKLAQVMMKRDATQLSGRVELDDAYFGGKRGRRAVGKTPFVAAVETTPQGKPVRLKLRRVASFCNHALQFLPSAAWIRPAKSSATMWLVLAPLPGPGAPTRSSRPAPTLPQPTLLDLHGSIRTRQYQGRHRRDLSGRQPEARTLAVANRSSSSLRNTGAKNVQNT